MTEDVGNAADARSGVGTDSMSIACRRDGTAGVIVLSGDVDLAGGDAVEAAVTGLMAEGVHDVSVQAGGVDFIDSSGLGGLLAARALIVDAGGSFRLAPRSDSVARVIDLAGLHDLLGPPPP